MRSHGARIAGVVVLAVALQAGYLLGGTIVAEVVFNYPGLGSLFLQAVNARDYPLVQGIVLVFGLLVVAFSFLGDTISAWLDPRTRPA